MAESNKEDLAPNAAIADNDDKPNIYPNMVSVNRISNLPFVESSWNLASSLYGKVKRSNSLVDWTLTQAENTVSGVAGQVGPPITSRLEGPMLQRVDSALCMGIDFVEARLPGVKLAPSEMYANTKEMVTASIQPALRTVTSLGELSAQKVSEILRRGGPDDVKCCDMPCCYEKAKGERCCRHTDLPEDNQRQCIMPLAGVKECSSCSAKTAQRKKSLRMESQVLEPIGQ